MAGAVQEKLRGRWRGPLSTARRGTAAAAAHLRGAHSPAPSGRRRAGFLVLSPHSDRVPHATESAPTPGGLINAGRRRHPALTALLTPARSAWGAWYRVRPPLPLFLRPSAFSRRCCLFPGACLLVARPSAVISARSEVSGVICLGPMSFCSLEYENF